MEQVNGNDKRLSGKRNSKRTQETNTEDTTITTNANHIKQESQQGRIDPPTTNIKNHYHQGVKRTGKPIIDTKRRHKGSSKKTQKNRDNSTKSFFRSYKDAAKQQWINGVKTTDEWKEGIEPTFTGTTTTAREVPKELGKFYKMLYTHKKINN